MKRADFLKTMGISSLAVTVPFATKAKERKGLQMKSSNCVLIPSETAGPFPLDLTDNTYYFRQDIREDREGAPFHVRMRIVGEDNCEPMANVHVNIWHCDNLGNYSGYGSESGLTYCRGYQMTDANGEVEFLTIFPGWYNGRVIHIHFQVHVDSNYSAVSQFTFDHDTVNEVYAAHPDLYPNGADPLTPDSDNIFNDGYEQQLSTLQDSDTPDEYEGYIEVTVQGSGTATGLAHLERMTAAQVELGQNHPNPFVDRTIIPLTLHSAADVKLELWHPSGQRVRSMDLGRLSAGEHTVPLDFSEMGLAPASYLYQLEVFNESGRFVTTKRMTMLK